MTDGLLYSLTSMAVHQASQHISKLGQYDARTHTTAGGLEREGRQARLMRHGSSTRQRLPSVRPNDQTQQPLVAN